MKELSIQEKAQFYDEAIERANELLYVSDKESLQYKTIKHILPYLNDSEDERIRTALIRFHKSTIDVDGIKGEDIIAWLEKKNKNNIGISEDTKKKLEDNLNKALEKETPESWNEFLDDQGEEKSNPYSGVSFTYNGHTWGMCARDNGVEILIDGQLKGRVFADDANTKEMFIKALERVEEQNEKGYKLTDCDKNSWWEDFKAYCGYSEHMQNYSWSEDDERNLKDLECILCCHNELPKELYLRSIDWLRDIKDRLQSQPK